MPRDATAPRADNWEAEGDEEALSPEAEDEEDQVPGPRLSSEQKLRKECGFSQSLVDDLKAHRLQIVRAHLAADFEVAFDLALYALCIDLFDGFRYHLARSNCGRPRRAPRSSLNDLSGTPADRLLETHGSALDLDWLKLPPAQGFAALTALPSDAKQRLFAWCIASCLKPQLAIEDRADPVLECAGARLAIPFADLLAADRRQLLGPGKESARPGDRHGHPRPRWERDHADDKKPALAAALETALDPVKSTACIGLDQAARDSAAAWLPPGMDFVDPASDGAADYPELEGDTRIERDPEDEGEAGEIDAASTDLPAFLTEDEPAGVALNGVAA